MRKYILFDNNDANNVFISRLFDEVVVSPQVKPLLLSWLIGVWNVFKLSKKNDKIVCWFDFQAVMLFWFTKFFFSQREIVCLNLLLKPKKTLKNRIVTSLYKSALKSPKFKVTVTSLEYGDLLNKHFGCYFNYILLHDVIHDNYKYDYKGSVIPNSVFCGGRNGRDWDFMMKIAESMPEVSFNIVVPENVFKQYKDNISSNINIKCNLSYDDFMVEMCKSEIVCLPLDTEAPAGLIVLFQAAANRKLIITTDTATTREYVNSDTGYIIRNDINYWKKAINFSLLNKNDSSNKSNALNKFLCTICSEQIFIEKVSSLL
jgi:glycosyltransferase involved in cell wall biosynthesis